MKTEMELKYVSAFVVDNTNVYLVSQKRNGVDTVELPGGKIEEDESPLMAILRELKEEIGLVESMNIKTLGVMCCAPWDKPKELTEFYYVYDKNKKLSLKPVPPELTTVIKVDIENFINHTFTDVRIEWIKLKVIDDLKKKEE